MKYVGSRYVPKFMGTYDATQVYEALCVVDNGSGTSYISQKIVPAGTPLTDTTYWAIYGATNGAIINLQNQIDDMKDGSVSGSLQQQIDTINDKIQHKTEIILFGDSWGDYEHNPSIVRIPEILEDHFHCTVHNYCYGGTGFDVSHGYDAQVADFAADDIDPDTIKCCILLCGLNEYQTTTTMSQFVAKLQDWNTRLRAVIGDDVPIYWFHNYAISNDTSLTNPTTFYKQFQYYNYVKENMDIQIIAPDTFAWVSSWTNDTHPDATGSKDFAMNMCRAIEGLTPIRYMYDRTTLTLNSHDVVIEYYYKQEADLDIFVKADIVDLITVTNQQTISYNHAPCAIIKDGEYLGCGFSIAINDYTQMIIVCNNPTMAAGYTQHPTHGKINAHVRMY